MANAVQFYLAKSMEKDMVLKTLRGRKKVPSQSVAQIVASKKIVPNTFSFGHRKRLACTLLHKHYTKTYRGQGIIFQTKAKPDYVAPFDLSVLIQNDDVVTQYYRIENTLHVYYNHKLIPGFEQFLFSDFNKLFRQFPSPAVAWKKVNEFRVAAGYKKPPEAKRRLLSYNEVIFHKSVPIEPVALFGYSAFSRAQARKLGIPHFRSARKFFEAQAHTGA